MYSERRSYKEELEVSLVSKEYSRSWMMITLRVCADRNSKKHVEISRLKFHLKISECYSKLSISIEMVPSNMMNS